MALNVDINRVTSLVANLGLPSFGTHFFDIFNTGIDADQCTVFAFRGNQPPDSLVLEGKTQHMRLIAHSLAAEYTAGEFTHDPNIREPAKRDVPTVYALRADQVGDPKYRQRFYDRPSLAHELVMLGQVDDVLYYVSLYRSNRRASFQPAEIQLVSGMAQFGITALHRHLQLLGGVGLQSWKSAPLANAGSSCDRRDELIAHLRDVLLAEPHGLSQREAQVCAGIILGYTTLAISLNFGITVNTVATHRKRAYRKLGVCSQNELFSRYFEVVNQSSAPARLRAVRDSFSDAPLAASAA